MHLDQTFLQTFVPDAVVVTGEFSQAVFFSIDSRTIRADELFVPIKGQRVDGHTFIKEALARGKGCLVKKTEQALIEELKKEFKNKLIIAVDDPHDAFIKIAAAWRGRCSIPVVGVTGSVGKTSTKNLIARILQAAGRRCFVSAGNQNTLLGASLNMVRLEPSHDCAVFEVGINKRGEMARIVERLRPTTGVITFIGHSHMEGLGSSQSIAAEKRDLFKFFKEDSIGIINGDQALLNAAGYAHPIIRFGLKTTNQVQARKVKTDDQYLSFVLKLYGKRYDVKVPDLRQEIVTNMLAAAAVAHFLEVDHSLILQEIQKPQHYEHRFQSRPLKGYQGTLIDDAYNASPESMKAALLALQRLKTKAKKIAVLGDMLELGQSTAFWHRQMGRFLRKVPSLTHLILVGQHVQWTHKTAPLGVTTEIVPSWQDAVEKLKVHLDSEAIVLVKASRGTQLSKLVEQFTDTTSSLQ